MYYDQDHHAKTGEQAYREARLSWIEQKIKEKKPNSTYSSTVKTLDDRLDEMGITRRDIYTVTQPKKREIKGKEYKNVEHILMDRIKGSTDPGRKDCMDSELRPTAKKDIPFAIGWKGIYEKMTGPNENKYVPPIDVVEFLHDYYIDDGNKRVSVSKFLNRSIILAHTKRMIPQYDPNNKEITEYYEFLQFEKRTGIGCIWFQEEDKFQELEQMIEYFTPQSFENDPHAKNKYDYFVKNIFYPFVNEYKKMGGKNYGIEKGDIFLQYLENVNDPERLKPKQIQHTIRSILHSRKKDHG